MRTLKTILIVAALATACSSDNNEPNNGNTGPVESELSGEMMASLEADLALNGTVPGDIPKIEIPQALLDLDDETSTAAMAYFQDLNGFLAQGYPVAGEWATSNRVDEGTVRQALDGWTKPEPCLESVAGFLCEFVHEEDDFRATATQTNTYAGTVTVNTMSIDYETWDDATRWGVRWDGPFAIQIDKTISNPDEGQLVSEFTFFECPDDDVWSASDERCGPGTRHIFERESQGWVAQWGDAPNEIWESTYTSERYVWSFIDEQRLLVSMSIVKSGSNGLLVFETHVYDWGKQKLYRWWQAVYGDDSCQVTVWDSDEMVVDSYDC